MDTTLNHYVLSRERLAEASELAAAGDTTLACDQLATARNHARLALAEIGASDPPVLRDFDDDSVDCIRDPQLAARLDEGFWLVQTLLDAYIAHPASRTPATPPIPLYGGPHGAMNARGAEAAARALARTATFLRMLLRR